jgi:hypothetical protein
MSLQLPKAIAAFFAVENGHDTEALAQQFADGATVRDEGRALEDLTAIDE